MLTVFEMKEQSTPRISYSTDPEDDNMDLNSLTYKPPVPERRESRLEQEKRRITDGIKGVWYRFDENFLKVHFGGESALAEDRERSFGINSRDGDSVAGNYELRKLNRNENSRAMGNTARKANIVGRTRNGFDDFGEEMISLTASFDDNE